MKIVLLCLLLPSLLCGQVQIGEDIDGEADFDLFGGDLSLNSNGSILAVGAPFNDGNGTSSGHVRVFSNENGSWTQIGNDIDGEFANDLSGDKVSLSSDGSRVAIGAILNDGNGSSSGHVRIYSFNGTSWIQLGQDIDGANSGDASGGALKLSSDGNIVAIGSSSSDTNGKETGEARVFTFDGLDWNQLGDTIIGTNEGDRFGWAIDLSSNGQIISISSISNDDGGFDTGQVRIFSFDGISWQQLGNSINGEAENDTSGGSISLSADGSTVAIGADNNDDNGSGSGHVRVFQNINGNWTQKGSDINGLVSGDGFGSVSISGDGNVIAAGGNGQSFGQVRIFQFIDDSWQQLGNAIFGEVEGDFARTPSISSDGSTLAIGASNNGDFKGHVRVYDLSGILSTPENNTTTFKIFPNPAINSVTLQLQEDAILEKVAVYNNLGQLVMTSIKSTIDTSELATGIYVVEITTTDGKGVEKLIIE